MFGVGAENVLLKVDINFVNLIGYPGSHSYGLSHKGEVHHEGESKGYCNGFEDHCPAVVGVYFNGPRRELSYFVNGVYQGVAFNDLNLSQPLYPMVSR